MLKLATPTVGEHAATALASFLDLRAQDGRVTGSVEARAAATAFACACLSLAGKFPGQTRKAFERTLPFTALERELLRLSPELDDAIGTLVAGRVCEWANRSPIFVDETSVYASDFIRQLRPHLDLGRERELAEHLVDRLTTI